MQSIKVTSLLDYLNYIENSKEELEARRCFETALVKQLETNKEISFSGFSWPAQQNCEFIIDSIYANNGEINFRERLVCSKTNLNNRIRACIHIFESTFNAKEFDDIYITEQCSPLANWMFKKYKYCIGSEYIKDCSWYYKIRLNLRLFPKKLNHQDLTQLNFKNEQFKYVLSFDCLEHIPDYKKALEEIYRVIKTNGKLLLSVPFDLYNPKNLVRATINKAGELHHSVEPEYHGDPVSGTGCLSFYTFGWKLLEELKNIGFKKSYILLVWSKKYAYLGEEQILICAEK